MESRMKASCLPSGEKRGVESPSPLVSARAFCPSTSMAQIFVVRFARGRSVVATVKANVFSSGESVRSLTPLAR